MNVIKVNVNFKNRTIYKHGVDLTSGDYNSTKLVFEFDRPDGMKTFEMKDPDGNLVLLKDIENNEIELVGKDENGNNASLFNQAGDYIFEISLYDGESKLTSASDRIKVTQEEIVVDGKVVSPYLPIFDQLINDIQDSIQQTDNLDLDIITEDDITKVEITRKDGTKKEAIVSSGGTNNYKDLANKPSINNVELTDDKSTEDLGIIEDVRNYIEENKEELKGADGKDGYTPIKGIDYFDGENGKDGLNGVDGYTPVKGVDYFDGKDYILTETDKEDISKMVEVNMPVKLSELENDTNFVNETYVNNLVGDIESLLGGI